MTKNERIAELEREVAELRLELQRLSARQSNPVPSWPYNPSPTYGPIRCSNCGGYGNHVCSLVGGHRATPDLFRPLATAVLGGNDVAYFTYENGRTKFLAMEHSA